MRVRIIDMIKLFKILFINIFLLILICFIVEISLCIARFNFEFSPEYYGGKVTLERKLKDFNDFLRSIYLADSPMPHYMIKEEFRKPALKKNNKAVNDSSIVLLGCSFSYGDLLKEEEAFHSLLNKQTNRNVYNLSLSGGSIVTMIYLMQHPELIKQIMDIEEPVEYIFYTYIPEQSFRYRYKARQSSPQYKLVDNKSRLEYLENGAFYNSFLVSEFNKFLISQKYFKSKIEADFPLYLKELVTTSKKQFPNAKFVMLIYRHVEGWSIPKEWNNLEGLDIEVIQLNDIVDIRLEECHLENDAHPNADAWEHIVPALVEKMKL